jgi:hypothetical protein
MKVNITPWLSRNKEKIYYAVSYGKGAGQRVATGIFTYAHPKNAVQRKHNKESLRLLEMKRSQLILECQAIGSVHR